LADKVGPSLAHDCEEEAAGNRRAKSQQASVSIFMKQRKYGSLLNQKITFLQNSSNVGSEQIAFDMQKETP